MTAAKQKIEDTRRTILRRNTHIEVYTLCMSHLSLINIFNTRHNRLRLSKKTFYYYYYYCTVHALRLTCTHSLAQSWKPNSSRLLQTSSSAPVAQTSYDLLRSSYMTKATQSIGKHTINVWISLFNTNVPHRLSELRDDAILSTFRIEISGRIRWSGKFKNLRQSFKIMLPAFFSSFYWDT